MYTKYREHGALEHSFSKHTVWGLPSSKLMQNFRAFSGWLCPINTPQLIIMLIPSSPDMIFWYNKASLKLQGCCPSCLLTSTIGFNCAMPAFSWLMSGVDPGEGVSVVSHEDTTRELLWTHGGIQRTLQKIQENDPLASSHTRCCMCIFM